MPEGEVRLGSGPPFSPVVTHKSLDMIPHAQANCKSFLLSAPEYALSSAFGQIIDAVKYLLIIFN